VLYRLLSVQRRELASFVQSFFGDRPVQVRHPLVSRRLLRNLADHGPSAELFERQVSAWFHAVFARPPRAVLVGEAPVLLLCILHNLLFQCHPAARQTDRLYELCRRRTEALIGALAPARTVEAAIVYHAVLERFEPFLPLACAYFEVQMSLERTVYKSPLTALLWMERLESVPLDGVRVLLREPEARRLALLSIVDKERKLPEQHLGRVREAIRSVELAAAEGAEAKSAAAELAGLRQAWTELRAEPL
jgi:hypothetical protein